MRSTLLIFFVCFLFSCGHRQEENRLQVHAPTVVEAKGYVVPKDSMAEPKVIIVDESKLKKIPVGKPKVVPTNTNVHPAGKGKVVVVNVNKLRVITPGTDTFSLPKTLPAIDSPFVAGIPEVTIAKDPHIKDNNPQSFSTFGKLQGLKHGLIRCMLQDKSGNLWFGTYGGGVSKYDGHSFTHITEKEGLSNNAVWSILEDKSGNLWFGTNGGGVSKYDGHSFTHFTEKEGLSNNVVRCILEDKSGNLWFGTNGGGVSKLAPSRVDGYDKYSFTHFTEKEGLSNNNVYSILEDKSGNLWFGTNGGGVSKYNGHSFTYFTEKEGLSNNVVYSILEDKSGNLWFGTNGGVSKYNGHSFTHITEKEGLSHNFITSILEDKSGNLWFGTNGGGVSKLALSRVEGYDGKSFTHFTEKEGLCNNFVFSILEDKSGNLWFGTWGGVSKYDGHSFTHVTEKEGLSHNIVLSILEDKSGNLWFGTKGGGVSKYDGQSFTHVTEKEGLSNNVVFSIIEDKSGNLWFGTEGGVSKYDGKYFTHVTEKEGLSNNVVLSILEDKSGNLWFGTYGGVSKYDGKSFTHFTEKEGLSHNVVFSILEDKSGNLWFGTEGGVSKYDGKFFTHFTEKQGLSHNFIRSILEDKSGNLWFGTYGGGVSKLALSRVDGYDKYSFTHFTEKEGLSHNVVLSILKDKSGNLWFGTRYGLSQLSLSKLNEIVKSLKTNEGDVFFKKYTYDDGFYGIGCNRSSMLQDKNGTVWIGANDRLTAFHPGGVAPDTIPPNIQLTGISLFNEKMAWTHLAHKKDTSLVLGNGVSVGDFEFDGISKWYGLPEHLSLAYNNNYLTFNFIGITMHQPKQVKYQYMLVGMDENWSGLTARNEATYGNLPQGTYTFKVKAMNSEGYWSAPFEYTFTIRPPWWKTWWAYTFYAMFIIGSFYSYIRWRERALRARQEELEVKVDEATVVIRKQKDEVEEKNREILDSIEYAKRIQTAILPPPRIVKEFLKNSFILYLPKDIVAGDFYWMESIEETIYFAACDCTGHGVPGAMVSVVCNNALNRAVNEFGERLPGRIFDKTRELVLENFAKSDEDVKDGMDASLCALNLQSMELFWAGANNPLWIYRAQQNAIEEIKADKQPIGKVHEEKNFTTHQVALQSGDIIYLFTDGYADQFGGEKNKKLTKAKFREFILSIAELPMEIQREKLFTHHDKYRGSLEQVDDICVMGVRV